jgi:hypothetical protein
MTASPTEEENQQQQGKEEKGGSFAKDSSGNVNVSRGIIGLASSTPHQQGQSVSEGTVADRINRPSRSLNPETGRVNPVTAEDLDKRIQLERSKAGFDRGAQEQVAIKARTEAQGFKYTPPEEYKNHPGLEATQDSLQEGEPSANQEQGEQVINVDNDSQKSTDNIKG